MITFSSENIPMPSLDYPVVERWIRAVAAQYGYAVGELNYIFCDDISKNLPKEFMEYIR